VAVWGMRGAVFGALLRCGAPSRHGGSPSPIWGPPRDGRCSPRGLPASPVGAAISRALGWALELREPLLRAVGCWGGSTASSEPHGSLLGATASVRGFAPRLSPGAQSAAQPTLQQQPGRQR